MFRDICEYIATLFRIIKPRLLVPRPGPRESPRPPVLHGCRRRGAARQDEPAARAPLPRGQGRRGGSQEGRTHCALLACGVRVVSNRAGQEGCARRAVRLQLHHARHPLHGAPQRAPQVLCARKRVEQPGLAGHHCRALGPRCRARAVPARIDVCRCLEKASTRSWTSSAARSRARTTTRQRDTACTGSMPIWSVCKGRMRMRGSGTQMVLGLASHEPYFFLLREEVKFGTKVPHRHCGLGS